MTRLKILALESYFSGSHRLWLSSLKRESSHSIEILSLPGRHWKWRLHGGAIGLAKMSEEIKNFPNLILSSSMLDTSLFLSLTKKRFHNIPVITYFHENQFSYPWSAKGEDLKLNRDLHYQFIQYAGGLSSDKIWFNSKYNLTTYLKGVQDLLKKMPDFRGEENISLIKEKSKVVPLGFDEFKKIKKNIKPVIVWNHRWEYDKNPEDFFNILFHLSDSGFQFKLIVLGSRPRQIPPIFQKAKEKLKKHIIHFGGVKSREEYIFWLSQGNILPVTSYQDFFGISIIEAGLMGLTLLLPNRLAYPEHIPEVYKKQVFYNNLIDLKERIINWNYIKQAHLHRHLEKYLWKNLIKLIDEQFLESI